MQSPLLKVLAAATTLTLTLTGCGGGSDAAPAASVSATDTATTLAAVTAVTQTTKTSTHNRGKPHGSTPTPAPDPTSTPTPTPAPATTAWVPPVTATWQWQLTGKLDTAYAVTAYDIDLFDTSAATIQALQASGKKVICYFSAGSAENWRTDYSSFLAADMGKALDGWAGERWLNTASSNVRLIMQRRLDLARTKGCDGVEPDNVDGYQNKPGFALTAATQLDYNRFLATEAHARGLAVGLKNDVDQLSDLAASFDFAVNEQCNEYSECSGYSVFIKAGKPVFNAEYASAYKKAGTKQTALCTASKKLGMHTLVLSEDLDDSFRFSCD